MEKEKIAYLAGLIDGDGSFSLNLSKRPFNKGICVTPMISISLNELDAWVLDELKQETGLGSVYFSNKNSPKGMYRWQTKNIEESLALAKLILPYLRIKKDRCQRFIEITEYYRNTSNPRGHIRVAAKGKRLRTRAEMTKLVKAALSLNPTKSAKRYKRDWNYWKPIIEKLYPE